MNEGHFAVVVGINRYPGIGDLSGAKKDAEDFREWLMDPAGGDVPEENIECVMVDDDTARGFSEARLAHPTVQEIDSALRGVNIGVRKLIHEQPDLWEKTRLYFYASGHGIAPSAGVGALLSAASAFDAFDKTLDNLEFDSYREWYDKSGIFHEVIVFADCCRERRVLTPSSGAPFDEETSGRGPVFWTVGYAAEHGQRAHEPGKGADDMRGYFTQALMDGLRGGAADRTSGEIKTDELARYVRTSLEFRLKNQTFQQQSSMVGNLEEPIVLRPPGLGPLPRKKRTITLCVQSQAPSDLILFAGAEPTEHSFARAEGTVKLDLPEDTYQVRGADGSVLKDLPDEGVFRVIAVDRDVQL